jgi:hypothetical protein
VRILHDESFSTKTSVVVAGEISNDAVLAIHIFAIFAIPRLYQNSLT